MSEKHTREQKSNGKRCSPLPDIYTLIDKTSHTYEHMMFEYCLAYMYLRDGAYLMSDDVLPYWSLAFIDFCNAMNLHFALVDGTLGITKVQKQG